MPKRIQRKRIRGWRMPEGAVYVGRPTKWGNPFNWQDYVMKNWHNESQAKEHAVWLFWEWLQGNVLLWFEVRDRILMDLDELRGLDLACWCSLDQSCHADALLEMMKAAP